eukprot:12904-Eustigmatos_ZCMA.PRE.1
MCRPSHNQGMHKDKHTELHVQWSLIIKITGARFYLPDFVAVQRAGEPFFSARRNMTGGQQSS